MKQITKFYLSSFLKNQTYFTPILIVFLQAQHLSLQQIFWVFSLGSAFAFLLEIPTGIFADLIGKKKSIIIAKFLILGSYLAFGFSSTFWMFVGAQLLYEAGNAFRTGTETAYIFDFLKQKSKVTYTEVKGKQKFWARLGESIATALGGIIAVQFGFRWVFFVAAIPALLNLLNVLSWSQIRERTEVATLRSGWNHARDSLKYLGKHKNVIGIMINITLFASVIAVLQKYIQPYMVDTNLSIDYFGFVYAAALLVTAYLVRYSSVIEKKLGANTASSLLTLLAALPLFALGAKYIALPGIALFFIVILFENLRSPIVNTLYHDAITSEQRATLGSVLSQSKSLGKMILLPVMGYITGVSSMYTSFLVLGGITIVTALLFRNKKRK
jgi:MFS family permease